MQPNTVLIALGIGYRYLCKTSKQMVNKPLRTKTLIKFKMSKNTHGTPMIFEKLTEIFRKVFNDETIVLNNDLTANDVSNWDSLTHMLMINEVENSFSVKFKLRELGKLDNVGGLVTLIESKLPPSF